jgi:hypothetical protein
MESCHFNNNENSSNVRLADNSHTSLNKAANLLGINELNNFDYKSLNSIRKLAKTLGCNEYDLMKTFKNNENNEKNQIQNKIDQKSKSKSPRSSSLNRSPIDLLKLADNLLKTPHRSLSTKSRAMNENAKEKGGLEILKKIKVAHNEATTNKKTVRKRNSFTKNKKPFLISNTLINSSNTKNTSEIYNSSGSKTLPSESKVLKKHVLNSKLYNIADKKLKNVDLIKFSTKQKGNDVSPNDATVKNNSIHNECSLNSNKSMNLNEIISNMNNKREVILYKDDKLGFGFIAGSEKPLVIRFVTPGNENYSNV